MNNVLICGKSYHQAMTYAKGEGIRATGWTFVADPDRLRGMRGSGIELIALPGAPYDVLQQASMNEIKIKSILVDPT